MKEYIRSFRTLAARSTIKQEIYMITVFSAVFAACATSLCFLEDGSDLKSFMLGVTPMLCVLVPTASITLLQQIFNCNNPIIPGYKYFHSISDSAAKFRRGIMVGNIIAILITALNWIIVSIFSQFVPSGGAEMFYSSMNTFAPCLSLAMIAIVNFTGFFRSTLARLLFILPACVMGGFVGGFSAGYEDEAAAEFSTGAITAVALAVCAAAAAGGIVFSALNAEKQWNKEGEKIEKRA